MDADYKDFKYKEITAVLVDKKVIVEIKATKNLVEENESQLLNI